MWNKRTEEGNAPRPPQLQPEPPRNPAPTPPPPPARSTAPPPPPPPAPVVSNPRNEPGSAARHTASIGASMYIKGSISTREELVVDGEVEGSLESHSLLTVGPNGKVQANIKAREVVIFGRVRGNVDVAEKIAIRDQGSLVGDIKAAGISVTLSPQF